MRGGARLPLLLLLGFFVVVAGVGIWLTVSDPGPPPPAAPETAAKTEDPPAADPPAKPAPARSEPAASAAPAEEDSAAGREADNGAETATTPETPRSPQTGNTPAEAQKPADTQAEKPAETPPEQPAATAPREPDSGDDAEPRKPERKSARPDLPVMPKALPRIVPDDPLPPAPDPALVQTTSLGPLPRIGDDGRRPMDAYAKPFNRADKRPRIAIVITGLGLSDAATESAIQGLAGGVTLAFAPYSAKLNEWIRLARAAGHEVLINVPMEPVNYPAYDPGPQTLLTSLNETGNLDRLYWALSRATGYVGVVDFLGSRFTTSRKHMRPVLNALRQRGLLFLDSRSTTRSIAPMVANELQLPIAVSTLTLDQRASRKDIDRKFGELEQRAKQDKSAIGIASPYPVTLERIAAWTRQLRARGIALAPVSALAATGKPDAAQ